MADVTQILSEIEQGDRSAAEALLLQVYDELRQLAAAKLASERRGHTLQATALVHEAYLRLVNGATPQHWDSRSHFYAAAAEAMRRLLIEHARRKGREKHGGQFHRVELRDLDLVGFTSGEHLLAISEALESLAAEDPEGAMLVKLRFFAGFSITEAAEILGVSRTNAYARWAYARAWLRCEIEGQN